MIKEYTISNFKAFSTPATLPIKPITLIYGANSAGKSSIFQSLLMLKQSLKHERVETSEGSMPSSLVMNGKYTQLNTFNNIVHNNEEEKQIEFEFYFSTKNLLKLFSSIKLPKQTIRLIDLFANNFEKIGVSLNFSNQVQLKSNSNIISELRMHADNFKFSLMYYEFHDIDDAGICTMNGGGFSFGGFDDVDFFWDIYWENIGKDRSVNIVKKLMYLIHEAKVRMVENPDKFDYDEKIISFNFGDQEKFSHNDLNKIIYDVDGNDKILKEIFNYFYSPYYISCEIKSSFLFTKMLLGNKFSEFLKIHNKIDDIDVHDIIKGDRKEIYNYIPYADTSYDYHLSDSPDVFMMLILQSLQSIIDNISYIGPFRNIPENYYRFDDIKRNMHSYSDTYNKIYQRIASDKSLLRQVNKYLSVLNIRYTVQILHDIHDGSETVSLVLNRDDSQNVSRIEDVGFGISQILPIVAQCVACDEQLILIEQPELHLHPALQAELGDLFIDSAMQKKNTLLIETHSEHILLRIMRRIRETTNGTLPEGVTPIRAEDVSVVYVESVETDGDRHSIIREMPLNDQGELVKAWPGGFFEEGLREVF